MAVGILHQFIGFVDDMSQLLLHTRDWCKNNLNDKPQLIYCATITIYTISAMAKLNVVGTEGVRYDFTYKLGARSCPTRMETICV